MTIEANAVLPVGRLFLIHIAEFWFAGANPVSIAYKLSNTEASQGLTGLIFSGANWPKDSRLIIQAYIPSNIRPVEIHFTCSDAFGDGTVIVVNCAFLSYLCL